MIERGWEFGFGFLVNFCIFVLGIIMILSGGDSMNLGFKIIISRIFDECLIIVFLWVITVRDF